MLYVLQLSFEKSGDEINDDNNIENDLLDLDSVEVERQPSASTKRPTNTSTSKMLTKKQK